MKKILLLTITIGTFSAQAQNTFPTSGNVGIGTTQPSAGLDVNANMRVDSSIYVKDSVVIERNLTVDQDVKFKGHLKVVDKAVFKDKAVVHGNFKLKSFENASLSQDRFVLMNPNGVLKDGETPVVQSLLYGSDCFPKDNGANVFYQAPSWASDGGPNITDAQIYTGVTCPAFVGIGTSEPVHNLEVHGNTYIQNNTIIGNTTGTTGQSQLEVNLSTNPAFTNAFQVKHINGLPMFSVLRNGNVGIANLNPNYKLHMFAETSGADPLMIENNNQELMKLDHDGLLQVREVKVTLKPFADYVFDDDYELMSIEETDAFIKENGHLPNMPSAEEVDKNGIGIGELQIKQQEKIEELTLYIIEQQKQIDELKALVNELVKK